MDHISKLECSLRPHPRLQCDLNITMDQVELAERIRNARKQAGLSQEGLAALSAISRRPVYLLETGKGAVRVDTLMQILDSLGYELEIRPKRART
jgi:DNA-binding XRE family transcriptional regulator